jgi:SAM-dependent methyltransferase
MYDNSDAFGYLRVDEFMKGALESRALGTAFELGIVDYLVRTRHTDFEELLSEFKLDRQGLGLIIDLLKANRVIDEEHGEIMLSAGFINVLPYIDLLRSKLDFANLVAADFTDLFTTMIRSPEEFYSRSRLFKLFSYGRCFERTPQNYELVKRWMGYTTALTRHEAMVCMKYYDFSRHTRVLDIGGNSGEFALRICKKFPAINATVYDLPLVCDIGEEHIAHEPEAGRISFLRGDALSDPMPGGFDLITFKSMLHDWPDREAGLLIERAVNALAPGGTLLIFERMPLEIHGGTAPYSIIPFLLFFRSFRIPEKYEEQLILRGFKDIRIEKIALETPFILITAEKKV